MVGETGQHLVPVAGAGCGGRRDTGSRPASDVGQAGVLADGTGAGATELDAVVGRRVVGGGEHRPGRVEGAGGEVEHVGRTEAYVDDVEALTGHPRGEGVDEGGAGGAHVPGDEDPLGPVGLRHEGGEGGTDGSTQVGVELLGRQAADVVRLEHRGQAVRGDGRGGTVGWGGQAGHPTERGPGAPGSMTAPSLR